MFLFEDGSIATRRLSTNHRRVDRCSPATPCSLRRAFRGVKNMNSWRPTGSPARRDSDSSPNSRRCGETVSESISAEASLVPEEARQRRRLHAGPDMLRYPGLPTEASLRRTLNFSPHSPAPSDRSVLCLPSRRTLSISLSPTYSRPGNIRASFKKPSNCRSEAADLSGSGRVKQRDYNIC